MWQTNLHRVRSSKNAGNLSNFWEQENQKPKQHFQNWSWFWVITFHATFDNISVIMWQDDSLVEKSRGNEESHRPAASHRQSLSHNVVSGTPCHEHGIELTTLVVICTDCMCSCRSITIRTWSRHPGQNCLRLCKPKGDVPKFNHK